MRGQDFLAVAKTLLFPSLTTLAGVHSLRPWLRPPREQVRPGGAVGSRAGRAGPKRGRETLRGGRGLAYRGGPTLASCLLVPSSRSSQPPFPSTTTSGTCELCRDSFAVATLQAAPPYPPEVPSSFTIPRPP